MARDNTLTKDEKRKQTLDVETEKQKKAIIVQLRKTPIVQLACERSDVGRSTYYKWRAQDLVFARAADRAKESGKFFINDLAESKLMRLIQDDNLTAIIFWLKHNHPKYATVNRFIHEYEMLTDRPSVEESNVFAQEIGKIVAKRNIPKESVDDLRERIEGEMEEEEQNEPNRKRMETFEEDSGEK